MMDNCENYSIEMFKNYNDVLKPKDLKGMLGIGMNKVYRILKNKDIFSIRIGNNYIIPKRSVIEYLTKK